MLRPLPPRRSISEVIASEKAPMVSAPPTTRTASAARKPNSNSGTAASAMYEAAPPSAGDDQRCPSTERVARGAPDDRESNERTELRDEEPHPGVDTRGAPRARPPGSDPGVQEYLQDQHGEHDGAQPSPLAMVVLRHLLIKRAERSKDRRSGVSKHEAAQPCYSASSIAAAIVSAW